MALQLAGAHVRHLLRFERPSKRQVDLQSRPTKLSLGYISTDFGPHAVGAVVRSIFGWHDKTRWRVVGFALGQQVRIRAVS